MVRIRAQVLLLFLPAEDTCGNRLRINHWYFLKRLFLSKNVEVFLLISIPV